MAASQLGGTDLRRDLLAYMAQPRVDRVALDPAGVGPDTLVEPFDSLFEQRVYLALRGRGYRVRPQYPVGRYRIDLVVRKAASSGLAVECDGDAFHSDSNAAADARGSVIWNGWAGISCASAGAGSSGPRSRRWSRCGSGLDAMGIERYEPSADVPVPVPAEAEPVARTTEAPSELGCGAATRHPARLGIRASGTRPGADAAGRVGTGRRTACSAAGLAGRAPRRTGTLGGPVHRAPGGVG
ncbi:hypothetical protein ACU686_15180 [Yinghuangia aomiensis]